MDVRFPRLFLLSPHFPRVLNAKNSLAVLSVGSFSNDDGDGEDEALQKMHLYFTLEFRSCVNLFSTL